MQTSLLNSKQNFSRNFQASSASLQLELGNNFICKLNRHFSWLLPLQNRVYEKQEFNQNFARKNGGSVFSNPSCNFSRDIFRIHPVVMWCFKHFLKHQILFPTSSVFIFFYILFPNVFHFSETLFELIARDGKIGWWHSHYDVVLNGFPFAWETILKFHSPNFSIHWAVASSVDFVL